MASIGQRGWRQAKTSLTTKFDKRFTLPLAEAIEHVSQLQDQVAELTDIVKVQVEMSLQATELLGRLLATASSRLDEVEDSLRRAHDDRDDGNRGDASLLQREYGEPAP